MVGFGAIWLDQVGSSWIFRAESKGNAKPQRAEDAKKGRINLESATPETGLIHFD
jgi:hypothetical protein